MDGGRLSLAGGDLLDAWERAAGLARPWAELALLAGASGREIDELARLPIGRRDALLLRLHEATIGEALDCEADCPACGERLELSLDVAMLAQTGTTIDAASIEVDGQPLSIRPPNSLDVAAALDAPDPSRALLERCLVPSVPLTDDVAATADARLAELDPAADLEIELTCPGCGCAWTETLDPPAVVLAGVEAGAFRLLAEVDALARAYGWREPDVLALSPERRRRYLELALA